MSRRKPLTSRLGTTLTSLSILVLLASPFLFPPSQAVPANPIAAYANLNFPVSLRFAPDGRIFYNEKNTGNIRVILANGTLLPTPFATVTPLYNGGESGLLGIALDPSFNSNGYVYVYYTDQDAQSYTRGHIRRYTAVGDTGTNPVDIFSVTSSAPGTQYHNGGYIKFGPDGKLYAQVGEFHQSSDAQNPSLTMGKILRMNSDGTVPTDNPNATSLVYATGFRNGFGFDFDPLNNRFIATMAGPSSDDKILIIVRGGNYGWPTCLGVCHDPRFIDPIVDITPVVTPTGIATASPNLYYFGEWNTGSLVRLQLTSTGQVASMNQVFTEPGGIIAVEMGPNGLYFTTPSTIFLYEVGQPGTPTTIDPVLVLTVSIVAVAVVAVLLYWTTRHRKRQPPPVSAAEVKTGFFEMQHFFRQVK